jgi:cytochrome c-type biogenesis protein
MQEWINQVLGSAGFSFSVLPAAFLFGILSAVSSSCNLAVIPAIAAFSGTQSGRSRRDVLLAGGFFMVGTIIALTLLGAMTGMISQVIAVTMGRYWQIFAGALCVLFGLIVLDLLPFRLPSISASGGRLLSGPWGAMLFGLALGGATTSCSVGCNPVLLVALGAAALKGQTLWGAGILGMFALGHSLPLAGAIVGLGLGVGKLETIAAKVTPVIKWLSGILLIAAGFYLLATL